MGATTAERRRVWLSPRVLIPALMVAVPILYSALENILMSSGEPQGVSAVRSNDDFSVSDEARLRQESYDDCVERFIAMRGSNNFYVRTMAHYVCLGHFIVG